MFFCLFFSCVGTDLAGNCLHIRSTVDLTVRLNPFQCHGNYSSESIFRVMLCCKNISSTRSVVLCSVHLAKLRSLNQFAKGSE